MLKGNTIYLRMLEPDDYKQTYQWHNDMELQRLTMGPMFVVSEEIEKKWTLSKSMDNQKDIYMAICVLGSNRMIGFSSINDIDYKNRKCTGGVVIGDKEYRDGVAMIESHALKMRYIFDELNIHRYETSCLEEHIIARASIESFMFTYEGLSRDYVFKNGIYHNVRNYSILRDEYYKNLEEGEYSFSNLFKKVAKKVVEQKKLKIHS